MITAMIAKSSSAAAIPMMIVWVDPSLFVAICGTIGLVAGGSPATVLSAVNEREKEKVPDSNDLEESIVDDPVSGWLAENAEGPINRLEAENCGLAANPSEAPKIREAENGKVETTVAEA